MSELDPERLARAAAEAEARVYFDYEYTWGSDERYAWVANWNELLTAAIKAYGTTDPGLLGEAVELLTVAYYTEAVTVDDFDAIEAFLIRVGALDSDEATEPGLRAGSPKALVAKVPADRLDVQVSVSVDLLEALLDPDDCRFDHHGGCQAHGYLSLEHGETCPQQALRGLIATADAK